MSIDSMTTLGVARNLRNPTKSDIAAVTEESNEATQSPSLQEILAKTVPVGLVTGYTAFIAVVTQVVDAPTKKVPAPEEYLWVRWAALAILVVTAAVLTHQSYSRKAGKGARSPVAEVAAVTVAAAAWGLGVPESPLLAAIEDKNLGLLVIALIGLTGVAGNLMLAGKLKSRV